MAQSPAAATTTARCEPSRRSSGSACSEVPPTRPMATPSAHSRFPRGDQTRLGVSAMSLRQPRRTMSALPPSVEPTVDGFATLARLEAELGSISDTRTVANPSGGAHLYLSVDQELRCSTGTLGPGIDVRCDGGYVVAPPSWITTTAYRWEDDGPILSLPAAWIARIQETRSGGDFH